VEAFRRERPEEVELALAFSEWGIPTSEALVATHRVAPHLPLIASGGLHHGLDAAKAIGLGADLTGFAHAVLAAASEGEEPVRRLLDGFAWQLRVAMFCAGAPNIAALKANPPVEVR
jgi:isopentenyl-diphosphate delta-isomerase